MKNPVQKIVTMLALCGSLAAAYAEEMKFGYINPERIYTETRAAQRIEATLQREFGSRQKQLSAMRQEGLKLQQQLADKKLGSQEKQAVEAKLQEAGYAFRIESARLAEEYNLRRSEEFAALQNNANAVIKRIAEQEKYDLIVQEAVFVTHKYDLTDRVIKLLDEMK